MSHEFYFKILKFYSDIWARMHCRVAISGEQHLQDNQGSRRIYIVSHPTTFDLPMLVHIAKNTFQVVVYKDPFNHPLAGWLFRNIGFPKLDPEENDRMIGEASRIIESKQALIYSLKGYGVDFGEDVKPRTGGIRIAHRAGADIYPVHLMIEPNKMIFKTYRDRKGGVFPYTIFKDTWYFVTFCKPLRYADYGREDMGYEEFRKIAYGIEEEFQSVQRRLEEELGENPERDVKRRGGSKKQVLF